MFIPNRKLEGTEIGNRLKLNADVSVLKGTFKAGTILRIVKEPDERGTIHCIDEESGEYVYVHPALSSYTALDKQK